MFCCLIACLFAVLGGFGFGFGFVDLVFVVWGVCLLVFCKFVYAVYG